MNPTIKSILAVIVGLVVGSGVNMGLVMVGSSIIPAPAGIDVTDAESIAAGGDLLEARHFIFPFLAHALGTLTGAVVALKIADGRQIVAGIIGGMFLAGGIMAANMIPAPTWFVVLDLVVAYVPMAWLATRLIPKPAEGAAKE